MKRLISMRKSIYKRLYVMILIVLSFLGTFSMTNVERRVENKLTLYSNVIDAKSTTQARLLFGDSTRDSSFEEELKNHTVQGLTPLNATVNLFDYWGRNDTTSQIYMEGIADGHYLTFGSPEGNSDIWGYYNSYTGSARPYYQIVKNKLEDGYPVLNLAGVNKGTAYDKYPNYAPDEESLAYLFNNSDGSYKKAYPNIEGLFQLDDDGYYYYNSKENYAELNTDGKNITLYDSPGVGMKKETSLSLGQFFPYNKASQVFNTVGKDGKLSCQNDSSCLSEGFYNVRTMSRNMNFYFGMSIEVDFVQPAGGMVTNNNPMTFEFSGDDDLWVFIDGVLVGDIGGIHDEATLKIDFSNGNIIINEGKTDNKGDSITEIHTLLEYFQDAYQGTDKPNGVVFNGSTFASDTMHTLKLFYMERGAGASNLSLKFNLQQSNYQQIKKVDQYGEPIQNVEFELYEAVETTDSATGILCTSTIDGSPIYVKQTGTALTTMVTDNDGITNIVDDINFVGGKQKNPFNFADRDGKYYILKEVSPATGYRNQPIDIVLEYNKDTGIITVANRWTTGSYASFTSYVTGRGNMNYGAYNNGLVEDSGISISKESRENGLVIAVPMLLNKENNNWYPLYGSNIEGFQTVGEVGNDAASMRKALLKAALLQTQYETSWHMTWDVNLQRLEGIFVDLPGRADRYRHINENGDMRMVYIILEPTVFTGELFSLAGSDGRYLNLKNYVRANLDSIDLVVDRIYGTVNDDIPGPTNRNISMLDANQFTRKFKSLVYVSNEQRKLHVQKVDTEGNPLNGSTFALYTTEEDARNNRNPVATGTTATVDGQDGMLIFKPQIPSNDGYAQMVWATTENTNYYLKEIEAPEGYHLNETVIPIVVGKYSIYADAGTTDNGVSVKAGVGKLLQTMTKYASDGDVNITLRDITAYAQIQDSNQFQMDGWRDTASLNGNVKKDSINLHYGLNSTIDYGLHDIDGGKTTEPFFITNSGYLRTRVTQNYLALIDGSIYEGSTNANKENLGNQDITSLFSLVNIVVVTDEEKSGDLTISKTVSGNAGSHEKAFTFTISLTKDGVALTDSYAYTGIGITSGTVTNGSTITLSHGQSITIKNIPVDTEYTVVENSANQDGYVTTSTGSTGTIELNKTKVAAFTNTLDKYSDLIIKNEVSGNASNTTDEFTFVIRLKDKNNHPITDSYSYVGSVGINPGTIGNNGTITLSHGQSITIKNLPIGTTYEIEESVKPSGYAVTVNGKNSSIETGSINEDMASNVNFVNTKNEYGDLKISKVVTGNSGELDKSFDFTIKCNDELFNGNYVYVENEEEKTGTITDGKFTLKHGDSITIKGLAINTNYVVTEDRANQDGYVTTSLNDTGVIFANETKEVTFTNTLNKYGNITISKTVSGNAGNKEQEFQFQIQLKDKDGNSVTGLSYTGTGVIHNTTISDGDSIVLKHGQSITIQNVPYQTEYKVTEQEAVSGEYEITSTNSTGVVDKETISVSYNNHKDIFNGLTIKKIVGGNNGEPNKDFTFKIFLEKDGEELTESYSYKGSKTGTITSGETFTLSHGQSITIENLPINTNYEVIEEEANQDGYVTTVQNKEGVIGEEKPKEVVFTNTRNQYGNLSISKKVSGNAIELNRNFTFKVVFTRNNSALEGKYSYKASDGTMKEIENGQTVSLKAGETIIIENLPINTNYEVIEVEANQDGYVTTSVGDRGVIEDAVTKEAIFTNTRNQYGNVKISKFVSGNLGERNRDFEFKVTLLDRNSKPLEGKYSYTGSKTGSISNNGIVKLKHNESIIIENLPIGVQYQVEEINQSGYVVTSENTNGVIENNITKEVVFTNTKNSLFDTLTVENIVNGNAGDLNKDFNFIITLTDKDGNLLIGTYSYSGSKEGTLVSGDSIALKHGESITIENLPIGVKYVVEEIEFNQDGYTTTVNQSEGILEGNSNPHVKFINVKDIKTEINIPNTGDSIKSWISLLLLSLGGIVSVLFVLYKNSRKVGE